MHLLYPDKSVNFQKTNGSNGVESNKNEIGARESKTGGVVVSGQRREKQASWRFRSAFLFSSSLEQIVPEDLNTF